MLTKPKKVLKKARYCALSAIIALAIFCTMLPLPALASPQAVETGLKRETTEVLNFNQMVSTDKMDDYGWKWDAAAATLTIDGLNVVYNGSYLGQVIRLPFDSTLIVNGSNRITRTNGAIQMSAIRVAYPTNNDDPTLKQNGNFTIQGNGNLDISNMNGFIFDAATKDIGNTFRIMGGVTINADCLNFGFMLTNVDFIIENSTVIAKGTQSTTAGIYIVSGNLRIKNSNLTASGLHQNGTSGKGITVLGEITIDGGIVTSYGQYYGIYAQGSDQIAPNGDTQCSIAVFNNAKVISNGIINAGDTMSVDNSDVTIKTTFVPSSGMTPDMHTDAGDKQAPCSFWGNRLFIRNNSSFSATSKYCGVRLTWGAIIENSTANMQGDIYGFTSIYGTFSSIDSEVTISGTKAAVYANKSPAMNANTIITKGGEVVSTADNSIYSFSENTIEKADGYLTGASMEVHLTCPADYTEVDKAIAEANALNKNKYTDFSAVETAISAVVRGKFSAEQSVVDGYADAIRKALGELVRINRAIAADKTYDGTPNVTVTDVLFKEVFDTDEVSADAVGTLIAPNAGIYTLVNLSDLVLKGKDAGWYEAPKTLSNVTTHVTISKAEPEIALATQPGSYVQGGREIEVTAAINNHYGNFDGLPTAEQIVFTANNAALKPGTGIVKEGNLYTAVFVVSDKINDTLTLTANVTGDAVNYSTLSAPATTSVNIVGLADYSKLQSMLDKIPDNLKLYTDKTVHALNDVVDSIQWDILSPEQAQVDGYTAAIYDAMKNLKKKTVITITNPDLGVKAEYEDGTRFDDDITLSVTAKPESELDQFKDAVNQAAPGLTLGGLYEITLLKDGAAVQPDGKMKVSIPLTDNLKAMNGLQVVSIDENGKVTIIPSEIKDGKILFATDNSSCYGVIGSVKAALDYPQQPDKGIPSTGDNTQILSYCALALLCASSLFVITKKRRAVK